MTKGGIGTELNKSELIQLMQVVHDFLVTKTGEKPELTERKSLAAAINQLFPKISTDVALSKINQRLRNVRRKVVGRTILSNITAPGQSIDETDDCEELFVSCIATNESHFEDVDFLSENEGSDQCEEYELC